MNKSKPSHLEELNHLNTLFNPLYNQFGPFFKENYLNFDHVIVECESLGMRAGL